MQRPSLAAAITFVALAFASTVAYAHFLWIVPGQNNSAINVYFSESAEPGEPELIERMAKVEAWRKTAAGQPQPLKLRRGEEGMIAENVFENGQAEPSLFGLRHDLGVISRGGQSFLLKYYAKTFAGGTPADWTKLPAGEHLPLDIVPNLTEEKLKLTVLWNQKPLAGAEVVAEGPGLQNRKMTTNDKGEVEIELKDVGNYSIRAKNSEETSGKLADQEYSSIRHYCTLTYPHKP